MVAIGPQGRRTPFTVSLAEDANSLLALDFEFLTALSHHRTR
jgi:hypothetical protein